MTKKIWLSPPHMGGDEIQFVQQAFNTNWISPVGPHIPAFENDIAAYIGNNVQVAALQSGTAALHLALKLCGVSNDDEVICQSLTFSASANPIVYQHAKPVFVDSEKQTWNMCADALERAIQNRLAAGKKPKAIVVVHLYGMPANMNRITAVAEKYHIALIEDAAEALGSEYANRKCGSFGDAAILSFNGNKIITTSGGGALVSRNPDIIERAKFLSTQARDNAPHYQHSEIGYNYRLSNVCAGIGRGQMKVLEERVRQRRNNYAYYHKALSASGVSFQEEPGAEYFSNRWLTCILLPEPALNEKIMKALTALDIECRPIWKPMHLQPVFSGAQFVGGSLAEDLFNRGLCLPSGSALQKEELQLICTTIKQQL
jgi:dTDP-4-amino-4,6-dideoxygalactose transaminase